MDSYSDGGEVRTNVHKLNCITVNVPFPCILLSHGSLSPCVCLSSLHFKVFYLSSLLPNDDISTPSELMLVSTQAVSLLSLSLSLPVCPPLVSSRSVLTTLRSSYTHTDGKWPTQANTTAGPDVCGHTCA